jgi:hypothetical protein
LLRTIALATLVAGTLDILSAFVWTAMAGGDLAGVLPSVASGPFGDGVAASPVAQPIGLLVHFAIMLVMAAVYVLAAERLPILKRQWLVAGLLYGLLLWLIMYGIVLQLRWDMPFPGKGPAVLRQLISHCLLVGLPIAWIAARRAPRVA